MEQYTKLTPAERLREETRIAAELGIQLPFNPLGNNAPADRLTSFTDPFDESSAPIRSGLATGIVAGDEPSPLLFSPEILTEMIRFQLAALNDENRLQLTPQILKSFSELASQTSNYETIASLHQDVLTKVFGPEFFDGESADAGSK